MKRKMILLALGANWDGFVASGLANFGATEAALTSPVKNLSNDKSPVSARPVKPSPASQRNSRRVRRQKLPVDLMVMFMTTWTDRRRSRSYQNSWLFNPRKPSHLDSVPSSN